MSEINTYFKRYHKTNNFFDYLRILSFYDSSVFTQVKELLPAFFEKFPTARHLLNSDRETIAEMLKDIGMKNVRADRIYRMSQDYLNWDGNDATKLFGIGKYGSDSYEIFYKNNIPKNVQDKELKRYIREELDVV